MEILSQGLKRHFFINTCMYKAFCFILGGQSVQPGATLSQVTTLLGWGRVGATRPLAPARHWGTVRAQTSPQRCSLLLIWSRRLISTPASARRVVGAITKGSFQPKLIARRGGQVVFDTWKHHTEAFCLCYAQLPGKFFSCVWKFVSSSSLFFIFFFFIMWILIAKSC